ncbi:MAG: nucleotide exchange factor GrpE [bacterium]
MSNKKSSKNVKQSKKSIKDGQNLESSENVDKQKVNEEVKQPLDADAHVQEDSLVDVALLQEKLKSLEDELSDNKDKMLRAVAEMENFKRRKTQELLTAKTYALESFIKELLPVFDSLERACSHSDESVSDVVKGVQLTIKQFYSVLQKAGVSVIETKGKAFDPNFHQAVGKESCEGIESDFITKEMQKGYTLNDRVLRPSMVMVAE